jgi:tRNA U34 2-thiouridine synthase MnmA/TrmU
VLDVDAATATVTVGERDALLRDHCALQGVVYTHDAIRDRASVLVQARAHGAVVPAALDGHVLHFEQPQPRVAPGQVVALYALDAPDRVVAGAIAA